MTDSATPQALRRAVATVAALNLGYFGVEFAVALAIGSVALFADSIDFLEDAAVNALIFIGFAWPAAARVRLARLLAVLLVVPSAAALWQAWAKFGAPVAPDPLLLSLAGLGALAVNLSAAGILARHRHHKGSLIRAAFLSARNDAVANVAIIGAALWTATLWPTAWPDLITGLAIAALNLGAAYEVWSSASAEHDTDKDPSA